MINRLTVVVSLFFRSGGYWLSSISIRASSLMAQVYPLLSSLWLISLISHFSLSISALKPCTVTGVSGYRSGRPMARVMSNFAMPRMSFL